MKSGLEHMEKTNNFLVSVIRSSPYGILAINRRGAITIANEQARSLLELPLPVEDLPRHDLMECIGHIHELKSCLLDCLNNNSPAFNLEVFSFGDKFLNIRGRGIQEGYVITIEDITQIKEMEMLALNSMLEGQELERRRIAKDIHDGLGPTLSSIRLMLEGLRNKASYSLIKEFENQMEETLEMIDSVTNDVRSISHQLMPKVLLDFGLVPALENLCSRINRGNKFRVNLFHSVESYRFDSSVELGLYRIGQELLNNALKHSKAMEIHMQLIEHYNSIVLMVEDNGLGFDKERVLSDNSGLGLINIESRTLALGGSFILDTSPGKGVAATIEIPIEK